MCGIDGCRASSHCPRADAPVRHETPGLSAARTYFFITGETSNDLLPRVLNPFVKIGLTPYRVHASSEQNKGDEMSVELRFTGLAPDAAETLAARYRVMLGVKSVIIVRDA